MPYVKLNTIEAAPKQMWEHITTKIVLLILDIKDDYAYCLRLENNTGTGEYLEVPLNKFRCFGTRGMAFIGVRKGTLPKPGDLDKYGTFNARAKNLGAK